MNQNIDFRICRYIKDKKIIIVNIKKELAKCKAANYEWLEGGEFSKDYIMLSTTKELKKLLNYE